MKILFILRNKNRKKQQKNVLPFTAAKIIKDRKSQGIGVSPITSESGLVPFSPLATVSWALEKTQIEIWVHWVPLLFHSV